jgi:hypothetical protein
MRSFNYSYNNNEVSIDVKDESGTLQFTAKFPTHQGAKIHWTSDMNLHCQRLNLPAFTNEDTAACQIVIDSMSDQ